MDDTGVHQVPTRRDLGKIAAAATGARVGQLVCLVGQSAGRTYTLSPRPLVIGRGADADIQVLGDDVSRRHARVSWGDHGVVLEDLDSRNGISINGVAVKRQTLAVGDRIQIASSAVLVYAEPDELEQRTMRLQTLETMTQLMANLSHDFNNMLGVIGTNAELLQDLVRNRYPNDAQLRESLQDIMQASETATALTRRLLEFGRRRSDLGRPSVAVDVQRIANDAATLVRRGLGHKIRLDVEVPAGLTVWGDAVELQQILSNLLLNAQHAMPKGGRISIIATALRLSRSDALAIHLASEGEYVDIRVSDTGIGMDAATQARIFEPFFTTRPGTGSGLGLSSVYGFVRSRGGCVLVRSAPGEGTEFRIVMPAPPSQDQSEHGTDQGRPRIPVDSVR